MDIGRDTGSYADSYADSSAVPDTALDSDPVLVPELAAESDYYSAHSYKPLLCTYIGANKLYHEDIIKSTDFALIQVQKILPEDCAS